MFVLRIFVVLVIATTFCSSSEAQLFRFRSNTAQQRGYRSQYDARAYQYTQIQPQTNYVPSQRTAVQGQACNCQQSALTPANFNLASQQLQQQQLPETQLQPASSALQTEVVSVTYRDRYSGRLFQQQYLVQRPAPAQQTGTQQVAVAGAGQPQIPQQLDPRLQPVVGQASSIGAASPVLNPSANGSVQTTSFENPVLELTDNSSAEFSILNANEGTETGSTSVLESSLPALEAPENSDTPGSILDSDGELDLDLPPLELDDSK